MTSKRSSICSFIQQGLKRKRRDEDEEEDCKRQKKNNPVIDMIERVIRPRRKRKPQPPCTEFVDLFKNFELPVIEWTNGNLGILQQQDEDDSIFCINTLEYMEFPKPPSNNKRQSNLLMIQEEEEEEESDDDDDSTLPMTPTTSLSKKDLLLLSQIENLQLTT